MNEKVYIATIIICGIIIALVGIFEAYNLGYNEGDQLASTYRAEGYTEGYIKGYDDGYLFGWNNGSNTGYENGYISGYNIGLAETGYNIRDPTYAEMLDFISFDQTNKNIYNVDTYNCYDYTNDVLNNAFNSGIKGGNVYINFPDSAHSIVCFNTTDKGLIFIDPQDDNEVTVIIDQNYFDRSIYEILYDDTVIRYGIIW